MSIDWYFAISFIRFIPFSRCFHYFPIVLSIQTMAAPLPGVLPMTHSLSLNSISDDQFTLLSMTNTWDDKVIDQRKLPHQVKIRPPLHWRPANQRTTFGRFHDIPNEVIFTIFEHSPLDMLMNLRITNSCAKYIVESWLPFRELMTSGADLARAAIAIEASEFLTVPRLVAVAYGDRCELCGNLGNFVQLVKCMRCCFHCLSNDRRLHCISPGLASDFLSEPVAEDSTVMVLGLRVARKSLTKIPKVRTITQGSLWGLRQTHREWALDYNATLQVTKRPKPTCHLPSILMRRIVAGKERSCYSRIPPLSGRVYVGEGNNLRFKTAIYVPGMVKKNSGLTPMSCDGILCRGCRFFWGLHSLGRHHLEHTMYSSMEIRPHLKTCPYAKLTWDLVLKLITPNPVSGRVLIPLKQLLKKSKDFRYQRSVNFGEMPWQFCIWFDVDHSKQVQQDSEKASTQYGDNLIEETQANWALVRPAGPLALDRYIGLWKSRKEECKKRKSSFPGLHELWVSVARQLG